MQVLRLTQEQINALSPDDREAVQTLVRISFTLTKGQHVQYISEKSIYGLSQSMYLTYFIMMYLLTGYFFHAFFVDPNVNSCLLAFAR